MATPIDLAGLQTEGRNPSTTDIDKVTTLELCQIINDEDSKVAPAVAQCLSEIAKAIDSLVDRITEGGRVIYVGAGTSGRLGVLDASELPPTFTANPEQFIALISGGDHALRHAQEGAEDDMDAAVADLKALALNGKDSLIGIAASGRTPYVLSCLSYAHSLGCCTVGIACSFPSAMSESGHVDHMISAVSGPEVVTGSTRLKAGTATKLILNMISTGTMIRIGKTYGNVMIDVKATNAKLRQRSRNILRIVCGDRCPTADAELDALLQTCDGSVKLAVASIMMRSTVSEARERLNAAGGILAKVLPSAHLAVNDTPVPPTNGFASEGHILVVDGGGSKCAAVIKGPNGGSWRGEGGPCNPTDVGLGGALSSIETAVQNAVHACPNLKGKDIRTISFAHIWVGIAGYDRPAISVPLTTALEKLFSRSTGSRFRITTDVNLLVSAAAQHTRVESVIALIAGTGSSAMAFSRDGDQFVRTSRSGGWGYLLGDDGSGFDIGKQGIRHCLAALDQQQNGTDALATCGAECRLCQRILKYFAPECGPNQKLDLLSTVIYSSATTESRPGTNIKKKIASVAPVVVELSDSDPNARAIVDRAIKSLTDLVRGLLTPGDMNLTSPMLVLAGGLMQSEVFQTKLKLGLSKPAEQGSQEMTFRDIVCVPDPATVGADCLIREQGR